MSGYYAIHIFHLLPELISESVAESFFFFSCSADKKKTYSVEHITLHAKTDEKQFVKFTPERMDEFSVWRYFLREISRLSAICMKCRKEVKTSGGSTGGLHRHLRTNHGINLLEKKKQMYLHTIK
jgi:hypothetical protein